MTMIPYSIHRRSERNNGGLLIPCWLTAVLLASAAPALSQNAKLRGVIADAATGQPVPCTVTIVDAAGQTVVEHPSFKAGFRCPGQFEKSVSPGRARIRITRGFETRAVEKVVDLAAGSETDLKFSLERVVDLRRRGWYAGDSHAHMLHGERTFPVGFDLVALTAQAVDLQYLSLAQAWSLEQATPEALEAELRKRSTPDCVLTWNLEAPKNYYKGDVGRCLGHCWTLGMRGRTPEGTDAIGTLLAASAWDYESAKPSFANFESHALIHAQGGAVFYSHPARWWTGAWGGQGGYPRQEKMRLSNMAVELPLDTLIGPTYDGLDVITGAGEYAANTNAFALWSLLLNHGYRLAATASSDACFDRPGGAVPGTPRVYTYLPGGFSLAAAARATAAGRTFVTTGPLLLATLEGAPPGSAVPADGQPRRLAIEAWASGAETGGLRRLEVLRNGEPFAQMELNPPAGACRTNIVLRESGNAWFCVRAFGRDAQRQRAFTGAFFFEASPHAPPEPVRARVHVRVVDAQTGKLLEATLTEIIHAATLPRPGRQHHLPHGEDRLNVPATVRLRAEASGYTSAILSPFLDHPALIEAVTRLEDKDLLDWGTYQRIRGLLGDVPLTFRLTRTSR